MIEYVSTSYSKSQVPTLTGTNAIHILINPSHPFFISPSDSPGMLLVNTAFDGKSFGGWKRGMLIALTTKNKSGFIDGSTQEPVVGTDLHSSWSRANNMVISWLLNSLSREISESVIYSSTAKDLWAELEDRFGQSSGAKLFHLQKELSDLVQGSSDIATYYTKMKRLWDELDTLDFFIPCICACSCGAKEKNIKPKQDARLVQFLMGLNDSYYAPRGNILMISPLASIPNAYALLMQEEQQREVQNTPKIPGESSSFIAASQGNNGQRQFSTDFRGQKGNYDNKKSTLVCIYSKKIGHSIETCYKIHGFPPDFKFTKLRNFQNSIKGNDVTSNEIFGDSFMTSKESVEHEKFLTGETGTCHANASAGEN